MVCDEDLRQATMSREELPSGGAMVARKGGSGSYRSPSTRSQNFSKPNTTPKASMTKEVLKPSVPIKGGDRECSYCGKNHTVDKCWKLHGRPEWADELIAKKGGARVSLVTTTTPANEEEVVPGPSNSGGDGAWF
ncbi:uncharacterized protein LOC120011911 [Tripterygium wilfordii]|uniref:uncharacterized protein LOC120011911 n=1 Tax=Tripterygium wilfordii TaxID=458696 RepID=UPI0018F8207A|nr:uncharacterized protein LOC120011911 [Tripterygium wilfordii]